MKPLQFAAGALLLLSVPSFAQEVNFRGKVEDVSGTTGQFFVDCTDTSLTSTVFDLNGFVGSQVEITGLWNGSMASPAVSVTAIQVVPETFEIGGGAKIGKTSSLGFTGAPGDVALGALALDSGFVPVSGAGVLFLDPFQIRFSASGTIGGSGVLEIPFQIPNDPSLVGLEIFGQGALLSGGSLLFTNPDCKEISD